MTRRDYETVARALLYARERCDGDSKRLAQHRRDCESIADALARDNLAFDVALFMRNAGAV
jgi:hypothetical protein